MTLILFFLLIVWEFSPLRALGQESVPVSQVQLTAKFQPADFGLRYDDNVYHSVAAAGRLADEIYLLNLGGEWGARWDVFNGKLNYDFGADQYQSYTSLSNLKNDFSLSLSASPGTLSFYYKMEYYFRNSQYFEFDYIDDEYLLGAAWTPPGPWSYEASGKVYSRLYYDSSDTVRSRNFDDLAVLMSVRREVSENLSFKLEGGYNNRKFYRNPIGLLDQDPDQPMDLPGYQVDQTWSVLLNAHLYFESVLQDINLEEQRTNSNSYGFSNTVESASWAGVVRPASTLYFQLFFRLYFKNYDVSPIVSPDLQLGFVDEDSQDLLSIRGTWEWAPQWMVSLGASRVRSESDQPGQYYIKNLLSAQIRKNF